MPPPGSTGRCLYDILGVSRDCSLEEIRSAYKKLALRLHPDKVAQSASGSNNDADATAAFQELQHAYDVLRDPKERAWYDSHRSQILFASSQRRAQGGAYSGSTDDGSFSSFFSSFFSKFPTSDGGGRTGRASRSPMDDIGEMYNFFSPSAYSGFSDRGNGFYKVYGDLFDKIYANEMRFASEVSHDEDLEPAPLMGNLDSAFEQWTAFYKYWLGFSTVIDFSWADLYDVREGASRRDRREMEELNNKARKKMRREYNDTVRSLAAFVKKRDKRVVEMLRKKKEEEEERKEEQRKKKEEEKRRKEEKARLYREAEWEQGDEEDAGTVHDDWFDTEANGKKKDSSNDQELYCVVCSKKFKSEKQWKNHEQSKKHRDKVAELRESLQEEDEDLGVNEDAIDDTQGEDGIDVGFDYVQEPSDDSDENTVKGLREKFDDGFVLQEEEVKHEIPDTGEVGLGSDDETIVLEAMISNHRNRKAASTEQSHGSPGKGVEFPSNDQEGESSMDYNPRRKARRAKTSKKGNRLKPNGDDAEKIDTNKNSGGGDNDDDDDDEQIKESAPNTSEKDDSSKRGVQQNRRQRDGRSAVDKDVDAFVKSSSKGKKNKGTSKAASNLCGTCGESFDSRNKLFAHLGDTGHAMLKTR